MCLVVSIWSVELQVLALGTYDAIMNTLGQNLELCLHKSDICNDL